MSEPSTANELVSKPELARLRADAERWRWVVKANPSMIAAIAWKVPEATGYSDPTEAVDAAIAAEKGAGDAGTNAAPIGGAYGSDCPRLSKVPS